jgi:hypothetical protein
VKLKTQFLALALALTLPWLSHGQGTFQNLGFESASVVAIPGQLVPFGTAFPGWVGYVGGVQQTTALYNSIYLDSSVISIIDSGWPHYLAPPPELFREITPQCFKPVLLV